MDQPLQQTMPPILVCDDEPHIRYIIVAKLRESGFEVVEARDGQEGADIARAARPRLILTDLQMPNMNGLELAQQLAKEPDLRHIPLVMLTARGYILTPDQLASTNIVSLLPKPFGVRQLLSTVRDILDGKTQSARRAA